MAAVQAQLDSHIRVVTPENIGFEYRVASPFERLTAYFIDCMLIGVGHLVVGLIIFFGFAFSGLAATGGGIISILSFLTIWFYGGVFETYMNGQTPGKRAIGLRVVRTDGSPINAGQAVLRNFLRVVDGLPPLYFFPTYLVGLISTSFNPRYQRLGDLACQTMVIAEDRTRATRFNDINDVMMSPIDNVLPMDVLPSRSLARAISQYVDRRRYFGPARRAEIARHIGEVFAEKYNLPPGIDHDALLCVLYRRVFLSQQEDIDALPASEDGSIHPPDFQIPMVNPTH